MRKNQITLAIQGSILALSTLSSAAILADDAQQLADVERAPANNSTTAVADAAEGKQEVERVTVTGSRLRRDSFSVTTPLVTIDKEAIVDTGISSLSEILVDNLPSVGAATSNTTSQSSVTSTGLSTIDLRDLGSNRTLTLIDGRRTVSNSGSRNVVSLNTIPSGIVQRVEVITGGSSAAYGADAVAGVVNIITQTDKEGLDYSVKVGESGDGGAKELEMGLNYGTLFDDARGYVFFSANWDRDFGLFFNDRERAQIEIDEDYDDELMCSTATIADGSEPCLSGTNRSDWRNRSDGIPGGVFLENSRNPTQFWYDGQTLRNDWRGNEEQFGINTKQFVALKIPNDNFAAAIKLDYELDSVKLYAQVQLSLNDTSNLKSPEDDYEGAGVVIFDRDTGIQQDDLVAPGFIPFTNPFVPQAILDAQPYKDRIYWDRRFSEVGQISTENERTTLRTFTGLNGTLFDDDWDWDLSVSYGRFKQDQLRRNELNVVNVAAALQAERLDDGTIQCQDAAARASGCVPLNLFGEGSITPEMADWIRVNPALSTEREQYNVLGYISGDLFEMPAGLVASVFGLEYRKERLDLTTSDGYRFGGITTNVVPSFSGDFDVYEAFAEVSLPLLSDAPLARSLSAEASLRVADYSIENVGNVASYKLGFIWEPSEGINVRANYARAQRAPTINELLSPARGDFDRYSDVCDGLTATSDDPGHANCRLDPKLAAVLAENATDLEFEFEDNNNSYSPSIGNSELTEETADTVTLGVSFSDIIIPNFRLAIDYYDISIEDAIRSISNENIINQCYDSAAGFSADNTFCNAISRSSEGNIIEVVQRQFNLDEVSARGYDVSADYLYELDKMGSLKFKLDYTHAIENSTTFEGNEGLQTDDSAGYEKPKSKASASVAWSKDQWRLRWKTKYLGKFTDDRQLEDDYLEALADNTERCNSGDDGCITNPERPAFLYYGSYFRHDLSVSYTTELDDIGMRFYGGVNNVFDDNGPFYLGRGNFYSGYGGGKGRFFYLGVAIKL